MSGRPGATSIFPLTAIISTTAASHCRVAVVPTLGAHVLLLTRAIFLFLCTAGETIKGKASKLLILLSKALMISLGLLGLLRALSAR